MMVARQRDAGNEESGTGAGRDQHPAGQAQGRVSPVGRSPPKREARTSVKRGSCWTLPSPRTAVGTQTRGLHG